MNKIAGWDLIQKFPYWGYYMKQKEHSLISPCYVELAGLAAWKKNLSLICQLMEFAVKILREIKC